MKEMVFETRSGDRLIGITIEPKNEDISKMFGVPNLFSNKSLDGVFIFRTRSKKITFLSHDELLRTRPITLFDSEYDSTLGSDSDA